MSRKSMRLVSIAVSLMLCIALAGCGNSAAPTGGTAAAASSPAASTAAVAAPVEAPAELTALLSENPSWKIDPNSELFKILKEKTNVNLTIQTVPDSNYEEKRNIVIASGDAPDIMYMLKNEDVIKYTQQGVLLALDDLIDKGAPNIAKYLTPDNRKKIKYSDGKIYSLPRMYNGTIQYMGFDARKDIMDELGIATPKTVDDFYNMLKAMKAKYPDVYPLVMRNDDKAAQMLVQAFAGIFGDTWNSLYFKDGKYTVVGYSDGLLNNLTFLNKLYKEKLLDPEFSITTTPQWEEKVSNSKGFVTNDYMLRCEFFNNAMQKTNPKFNMDVLPLPQYGDIHPTTWVLDELVNQAQYVINAKTKSPEAAVRFFDYLYSDEGAALINWGIEGKTYTVKDGKKEYLPSVITAANPNGTLDIKKDYLVQTVFDCIADVESFKALNLGVNSSRGFDLYNEMKFGAVIDSGYVTDVFTQEDNDNVAAIRPQMEKFIVENEVKFIMGTRPLSEYGKFQEELKTKMKADQLIQIYQNAYDKKYAK